MSDIVPDLLKSIEDDFFKEIRSSNKLKNLKGLLDNNNATYVDANEYALEVGEILSKAFKKNINHDILPEGRMFFNIGDRILSPTLSRNHDMVADYTKVVQEEINRQIGVGLKAVVPKQKEHQIKYFIDRLDNELDFEKIEWILDEPVIDFTQQVVNEVLQANAEFQSNIGLRPTITRTLVGGACEWCVALVGTYTYPDVPDDIYKRHERCRCTVEYSVNGKEKQDVWSKKWR